MSNFFEHVRTLLKPFSDFIKKYPVRTFQQGISYLLIKNLRIHIHIHDPGHDQIKPGSRIGKPGGKERQHHIHGDLSVDHMTCWASEFSPETAQQITAAS